MRVSDPNVNCLEAGPWASTWPSRPPSSPARPVASGSASPDACAYSAAKAGVIGFSKGLTKEPYGSGVMVNCVAPVMVETDLLREMSADYIETIKAKIPMGRLCTVEEIADMVAWIASPRCSFTTGAVFDLSGGRATY